MPYLGGPSFAPLYPSDRSKDLPEDPHWADRAAGDTVPDWTDVLIDFQTLPVRDLVPETLPDVSAAQWPATDDGWGLEGWAWTPPAGSHGSYVNEDGEEVVCPVDGVTVARFTDPDGFRFAFLLSQDRPGERPRFMTGRLQTLLPAMRFLFATDSAFSRQRRYSLDPAETVLRDWAAPGDPVTEATRYYSLTALRDAVKDPAGWFGTTDWAGLTLDGPFRPIVPARALLGWASGGATSFDAEIERWARAGLDACELAGWRAIDRPEPDPSLPPKFTDDEIVEWFAAFGGGSKRRSVAARWHATGLSAALAGRWMGVMAGVLEKQVGPAVESFESAGWSPAEVTDVLKAVGDYTRTEDGARFWSPWASPPPSEAVRWTFVAPGRACAYLAAGYNSDEVQALEEAGEPVDPATLSMLAAMLPEPAVDLGGF